MIWIISDTHLGARNNNLEWLEIMTGSHWNWFVKEWEKRGKKSDILIHCGDVFDNRQSLNLQVLYETTKIWKWYSEHFSEIWVIAGNHDIHRRNTTEITSLEVLRVFPNVHIILKPENHKIGGKTWCFLPWVGDDRDPNEGLTDLQGDYLVTHSGYVGMKFDAYTDIHEGILVNNVSSFKYVFSGHIHRRQILGNVIMVGNPYQMTRTDSGNSKGVWNLDNDTDKLTFIENTYSPRFLKTDLEDWLDKDLEEFKNFISGNFVDLRLKRLDFNLYHLTDWLQKYARKFDVQVAEINETGQVSVTSEVLDMLQLFDNWCSANSANDEVKEWLKNNWKNLNENK